jgi:tripartite-type tricarboxylate transporter receptor subunit TctC
MRPSQPNARSAASSPSSRRRFLVAAGAASAGIALPRVALGTSAFPTLAGRTVTMIIGADLGGGYDLFARAIASQLQEVVPGLGINIQNIGKAGGKLAAKMVQEGSSDGGLIAMLPVSLMSAQILQEEGVAYDVASWGWIGKLASEARLYLAGPGADFATIEELRARGSVATMAVRSTSSFAYYEAMCVNAMLGTKVKPVPGYKSGEKEQAMMSGEVMLVSANYPDDRSVVEAPGVRVVLRVNEAQVPDAYAQVPTLRGLLGRGEQFGTVLRFLEANYELARWLVAPPSTDPAVLQDWRAAFDATVRTPEFLDLANKLDMPIVPMSGADLAKRIGEIMSDEERLRADLSAAFACGMSLSDGAIAACHQS